MGCGEAVSRERRFSEGVFDCLPGEAVFRERRRWNDDCFLEEAVAGERLHWNGCLCGEAVTRERRCNGDSFRRGGFASLAERVEMKRRRREGSFEELLSDSN